MKANKKAQLEHILTLIAEADNNNPNTESREQAERELVKLGVVDDVGQFIATHPLYKEVAGYFE